MKHAGALTTGGQVHLVGHSFGGLVALVVAGTVFFNVVMIADVARSREVQDAFAPLQRTHEAFLELVRTHAKEEGPVVYVDLTDAVIEVAGKFVTFTISVSMRASPSSRCNTSKGKPSGTVSEGNHWPSPNWSA